MKYNDFYDDMNKMFDFLTVSKKEFLKSYSYLTEYEYDLTKKKVENVKNKSL